jgi:hypothetical protein
MKFINTFRIAALVALFSLAAHAQMRGVGLGAYLQAGNAGEVGGLNAKMFLDARTALDLSLSIENDPFGASMGAYASYLIHHWDVIPVARGKMPLYIGPNGGVGIWNGGTAIRFGGIGGMAYCMDPGMAPLDFYLQLNPTMEYQIFDGTHNDKLVFDLYLQLGMRFFL